MALILFHLITNLVTSSQIDLISFNSVPSAVGGQIEIGSEIAINDTNSDYWQDHLLRGNDKNSSNYFLNSTPLSSNGDSLLAMEHAIMESAQSVCTTHQPKTSPIFLGMYVFFHKYHDTQVGNNKIVNICLSEESNIYFPPILSSPYQN